MVKKMYILAQGFAENGGSFFGFVEEIAKAFSGKRYAVKILCRKMQKAEKNYERFSYAEVYRFQFSKFPFFNAIAEELLFAFKVNSFLKKDNFQEGEIIIANGLTPLGLKKRYILRAPDQPVLTFLKNMALASKYTPFISRIARALHFHIFYFMDKRVIRNATAVIYSSEANRQENIKQYGVVGKPYFIPNKGIDISYFKHIPKKKKSRKLLFVAHRDEKIRKGAIYLERILPKLFTKYPDAELTHVGEKSLWDVPDWCRKRINSTGKVPKDKMREYYMASDILVFCALNEGIPATIMEAMASKLPIVTSDIEGVGEYIEHMKGGYIYRRGDAKGLLSGISYMLDNPEKSMKMAENSFEKIKSLDSKKYYPLLLKFAEDIYAGKPESKDILNS